MAYTAYLSLVQELFIGYYQRPAGPVGLVFWATQIDNAGGNASAVVDAFANSAESQALYGPINSSTISGVVTQVFNAIFNRDPSPTGLDFYVDGFNDGTFTAGTIVLNIIDGATGVDRTTMDNKLLAADLFTETIDPGLDGIAIQATYSGAQDALYGRIFLDGVSSIPESIPTQAETTKFIQDYIADTGDPILNFTSILTPLVDNLDFTSSLGSDIVQGIQAEDGGTLTNGDVVKGNGFTVLDLIADGGEPVFATLTNLDRIDITSAESTTIEAVGFSNIGSINVKGGSNGNDIFVENLDPGTPISISGVTGTISASYDIFGADNNIWVFNGDPGTTASALLDADGNVFMNLPNEGSGEAQFWGGEVELGTIDVLAGDDTFSEVELGFTDDKAESVLAGDVTVTIGNSSSFFLDIASSNDVTIGNVDMLAGSSATLDIFAFASGDTIFGNIDMAAGDYSKVDVFLGESKSGYSAYAIDIGDITVGDINMAAGYSSSVDIFAGAHASASNHADAWAQDITLGDISMTAGVTSSVDIYAGAFANAYGYGYQADADVSSVSLGDISMIAGSSASMDLYVGAGAQARTDATADAGYLTLGDVSMAAGESSDLELGVGAGAEAKYDASADLWGGITIGDIGMVAGDSSDVQGWIGAYASASYSSGDADASAAGITVGDISMAAGDFSDVDLYVGASASGGYADADVSSITIGNISMVAGDGFGGTSDMELYIGATASGYWSAQADVGDIIVGDISMAVGDSASVDLFVGASATAYSYAFADASNITVGDVDVTIGNGISSTATVDRVFADIDIGNTYAESGESVSVGDVTVAAGNYADLYVKVWNYNSSDAELGSVAVGEVSVTGGEAANVDISVDNWLSGSGTVGDVTVGGVDVLVAQDSSVFVSISQWASTGDVGNLNVGDVSIIAGDNATITVSITSSASSGNAGTMTVGDIYVAASATTTVDLSGFSSIAMTIDHMAWGSYDLLGAETIGDISLSVGNESHIDLEIDQTGTALLVDDLSIGAIDLVAGNSSSVESDIYFTNYLDDGNLGDFSLEGFSATIGNSSDLDAKIYMNVDKTNDGDLGDVDIGSVSLDVGENSYADFTAKIQLPDGDAGNLSFGDFTVVAAKSADVDIWTEYPGWDVSVSGDIGNLSFGDLDFTVGVSADVYWSPDIWAGGDVGNVSVGDISADLAADAYLSVSLNVGTASNLISGDIGDITIGDINVTLGESADLHYLDFTFAATDDIGAFTIGDITIDAGPYSTADNYTFFYASASDDIGGMTVGDISITGQGGSDVAATFSITAGEDSGAMTVGDLTLTGVDGVVTEAMLDTAFVEADLGKHVDGAEITLNYKLTGTVARDFTVGDITANLDTLSMVAINITNNTGGNVIIGDLTVTGAVGQVTYAGTAADQTGFFNFPDGSTITTGGTITIGDVDYSGYLADATIDMSWTDFGAAVITGSANDDTITGNAKNNIISGGKGVDDMTGNGGADTFAFVNKDSGITAGNIDTIEDWDGISATPDLLDFNLANGSAQNYAEGGSFGTVADFVEGAADILDSTVKYFAGTVGSDTYVAVNYGSGEADLVVELVNQDLGDIAFTNIIA